MATPEASQPSAKAYLQRPEFHQKFTLAATARHGAIEVAYSDAGAKPTPGQDNPPVLLFMPGLLATRLIGAYVGIIAEKVGVRVIIVDRFGIGQTTNVPVEQRIATWVELVPKLLEHLGITSVSLVSHSAGTLYLFNTLHACRDLLSPTRPYAVFLGPWVDLKHSRVMTLQAAQLLPSFAVGQFGGVVKGMNSYVGPVVGSSLTMLDKWFSSPAQPDPKKEQRRAQILAEYGITADYLNTVNETLVQMAMREDMAGLGDETKLLLKKAGDWGACEDFKECVVELAKREKARPEKERLHVKVYFAEQDMMIGERGKEYMESCWKVLGEGDYNGAIEVDMKTVEGTDHDSLCGRPSVLHELMAFMK